MKEQNLKTVENRGAPERIRTPDLLIRSQTYIIDFSTTCSKIHYLFTVDILRLSGRYRQKFAYSSLCLIGFAGSGVLSKVSP